MELALRPVLPDRFFRSALRITVDIASASASALFVVSVPHLGARAFGLTACLYSSASTLFKGKPHSSSCQCPGVRIPQKAPIPEPAIAGR